MLENHKYTWTYFYLFNITQIFTNDNIYSQRKKEKKREREKKKVFECKLKTNESAE